ncbi:hypothetical protein [Streptomyces sp. 058-1L]|uniref:hypothetical protein n=1 Tax=Streptomyces sp. 058-1L TaxID=2789266 RepID=UPI0039818B7C
MVAVVGQDTVDVRGTDGAVVPHDGQDEEEFLDVADAGRALGEEGGVAPGSRTTKSASWPGSRVPTLSSVPMAWALPGVARKKALTESSG